MRRIYLLTCLAIAGILLAYQPAPAWVNFKVGVGGNLAYQSGGNCLGWGLYRNAQPPTVPVYNKYYYPKPKEVIHHHHFPKHQPHPAPHHPAPQHPVPTHQPYPEKVHIPVPDHSPAPDYKKPAPQYPAPVLPHHASPASYGQFPAYQTGSTRYSQYPYIQANPYQR